MTDIEGFLTIYGHSDNLLNNNKQLLDEVEQNIVICLWRADQLFADAEAKAEANN